MQDSRFKLFQKLALVILKISITAFCVVHIFQQFGHEIKLLDRQISWIYIFAAILAFLVSQVIAIWRWNVCCTRLGVHECKGKLFTKNLFKYYFIGLFSNNFIPGSFGGDLIRAYLLKKNIANAKWINCVGSVFIDRASGLFAMTLLALAACFGIKFWTKFPMPASIVNILFASSVAWIVGLVVLFVVSKFIPRVTNIEPEDEESMSFINKLKLKAFEFINAMRKIKRDPSALFEITLSSLLIQILVSFCLISLAKGLNLNIEAAYLWIINSLATLGTLFTPSMNGLGVRENIYAYFFQTLNQPGGDGVVLSGSWLLTILIVSLPGLFYLIGSWRAKQKALVEVPIQSIDLAGQRAA
ncbi:MAG: lysylphosphatidylglycerol synthase transmembrane domain-containing protein [Candidatus Caenarcaniphilales bacterium]|nr:lysylphosphatidylglycerol synthase transmembrane domain-containing protein [Candidatus Caenarcaniphilales bacterium]